MMALVPVKRQVVKCQLLNGSWRAERVRKLTIADLAFFRNSAARLA
jgi:hypothetical protein